MISACADKQLLQNLNSPWSSHRFCTQWTYHLG